MIKKYNKLIMIFLILSVLLSSIFVQAEQQGNYSDEDYSTFIAKNLFFGVQFENNSNNEILKLILPNGNINILSREKAASGAKYSNENITFWSKGNEAHIYFGNIYFKTEITNIKTAKLKNYFNCNNENINNEKELTVFKSKEFYTLLKEMNNEIKVIFPNQEFVLTKERTASGAKYSNNNISIWNKEEELLIQLGEFEFNAYMTELKDLINEQKFNFKASGQEPGWQMLIKEQKIHLFMDYKNTELHISPLQISEESLEGSIIYKNITTSLFDFQIKIIKNIHTDIMSGQKFPYTVKIINDDKYIIGGGYYILK